MNGFTLAFAGVAVIVALVAWDDVSRWYDRRGRVATFVERCAADQERAICEARADTYGKRCWEQAFTPGGRWSKSSFSTGTFEACLLNAPAPSLSRYGPASSAGA